MALLSRLLRFLFWVVIVSWGFRLLGRFIANLLQSGHPSAPVESDRDLNTYGATQVLVRDPVCGVHVAESRAVALQENGQLLHFCSTACRDSYLSASRQLAANA